MVAGLSVSISQKVASQGYNKLIYSSLCFNITWKEVMQSTLRHIRKCYYHYYYTSLFFYSEGMLSRPRSFTFQLQDERERESISIKKKLWCSRKEYERKLSHQNDAVLSQRKPYIQSEMLLTLIHFFNIQAAFIGISSLNWLYRLRIFLLMMISNT